MPIGVLIGIATTAIGFTAWTIIVPLLFAGFKSKHFTLFESLFLSVVLDCLTSGSSTVVFSKQSKVDWPLALRLSFTAIVGSLFGLVFSKDFLLAYQDMFKRGLGYVSLLIGLSFYLRAYRARRAEFEGSRIQMDPITTLEEQLPPPKPSVLAEAIKSAQMRMWIAIALTFITGIASGLIGFGGGMIFVLVLMAVLQKDQLVATGTGCFVMCLLTAWLTLIYQMGGSWLSFAEHIHMECIWKETLMVIVSGVAGTIVGSFLVLSISPFRLNVLVGSVLFATGSVASFQAQLFPDEIS